MGPFLNVSAGIPFDLFKNRVCAVVLAQIETALLKMMLVGFSPSTADRVMQLRTVRIFILASSFLVGF